MKKVLFILMAVVLTLSCQREETVETSQVLEETTNYRSNNPVQLFDGTEGGYITLTDATTMIDTWQSHNNVSKGWGVSIGEDIIFEMLDAPGSVGITITKAEDNGFRTVVLTGHDVDGNDITQPADRAIRWPRLSGKGSTANKIGRP